MVLDPKIFADAEERLGIKFPARGTPVLVKNRHGNVVAGNVGTVWLAMDTVCIDIEIVGGTFRCYPELGDKFKTWED
jgi:hypothetical protein